MTVIPKIYKHGIEITKPWNQAMYDYNDKVRAHMIKEIQFCINTLQDVATANKLARIINPYGYGVGYELEDMKADMLKKAASFENYWLAEIWDELIEADFVMPNFGEGNEVFHIIGFESRKEILELRKKFA
jgi:hypothetical protein